MRIFLFGKELGHTFISFSKVIVCNFVYSKFILTGKLDIFNPCQHLWHFFMRQAFKIISKFDSFVDFTFVYLQHVTCAIFEHEDTNVETTD